MGVTKIWTKDLDDNKLANRYKEEVWFYGLKFIYAYN